MSDFSGNPGPQTVRKRRSTIWIVAAVALAVVLALVLAKQIGVTRDHGLGPGQKNASQAPAGITTTEPSTGGSAQPPSQ